MAEHLMTDEQSFAVQHFLRKGYSPERIAQVAGVPLARIEFIIENKKPIKREARAAVSKRFSYVSKIGTCV